VTGISHCAVARSAFPSNFFQNGAVAGASPKALPVSRACLVIRVARGIRGRAAVSIPIGVHPWPETGPGMAAPAGARHDT
jgi:hypothetical protein